MLRISRRSLRKGLIAAGCLVGSVAVPQAVIGAGLILLGSGLHLWSKGCLEQNRRLTTAGPYRWTRNPFYLANLLIDLGLCFVIGNPWLGAIYATLWWLSYRDTIDREEERLAGLFPDEYATYRSVVPRLIPTGRALPSGLVRGRFSFDKDGLVRGAEYARLLGIAIAPGVIGAAEMIRREGIALFGDRQAGELAFVLLLLALWIVKLAVAETFRRPETALVPWALSSRVRWALALVFAILALVVATRLVWLAVLPGLWCVLSVLDLVGDLRHRENVDNLRSGWRYSRVIATGSLVAVAGVAVLSH